MLVVLDDSPCMLIGGLMGSVDKKKFVYLSVNVMMLETADM